MNKLIGRSKEEYFALRNGSRVAFERLSIHDDFLFDLLANPLQPAPLGVSP